MIIIVNGESKEVDDGIYIGKFLELQGISKNGTAIAVNTQIVKFKEFQNHILKENDKIEIIRAIGGG